MTVIKPNPILQLLIILGPLTGFIAMFALLVELLIDGDFQRVYFILVAICILLGLVTCLLSKVVLSSKITASKQGIRLSSKKYFSWSDVSKVEANMWTGRNAGIKIYLRKNIYHDVPFWQRPLGSKELYHVEFNTGMLFTASSQEIVNLLIEARQKEY
ncbi:hypothetical protein Q9887_004080 [Vibrio fluvialis]|nr:hypothetical protein [Vibrio fluvialis]ELH0897156.1 hypothetical protein [Vibrio fluvialis]